MHACAPFMDRTIFQHWHGGRGPDPIYIYTKTGRLIREWIDAESRMGWRPAGPGADGTQQWPAVGGRRIVTDDFNANGAFLSHSESRQRLGDDSRIDTQPPYSRRRHRRRPRRNAGHWRD
jgi:hypothetical protein